MTAVPTRKPADDDGDTPPKPPRKPRATPAKTRKPLPAPRSRIGEDPDDNVQRRRPPRAGVDDVLTAEVLHQMTIRKGWSRSEAARQVGWNVHSAARLLSSKGPRQSWTVGELVDMAKGLGCSVGSLVRGAGIDPPEVDELDVILSSGRLSATTKQAVAQLIRLERMARQNAE